MNIWKISVQNIKSKTLYSLLSIFTLSLSIALLLGIQQLKTSFEYQLENNLGNVDMVVGAKGSPLQLVLSSVLHLDNPTGNIPYHEFQKMAKNPMIKHVAPISYGDNYKGYRIVGTTAQFASFYNAKIDKGNATPKSMEAVLGFQVAKKLQLNIGDTFSSSHGLTENTFDVHEEKFTVVGVFKPTQNVIDRLIVTHLESVWDVHNHDNHKDEDEHKTESKHQHNDEHHHHKNETDQKDKTHHTEIHHDNHHTEKEITSLLISFRNPAALLNLPRSINKNTNMQAALPKYEIDRLYQFTGIGIKTISWIAYLILVISGVIIFISLYKMVKDRAFDLALLRTYGASNFQLVQMILYEGLIIAGTACIVSFALLKALIYIALNTTNILQQQELIISLPIEQTLQTLALVLVMIVASVLLAILPIVKMSISTILSHEK